MTGREGHDDVFDITDPLPRGTVVLEASAGTGKTYAIAALAVRYIAEVGIPLPRLLLITFSRMASAELRSRVYQRLQATRQALSRALLEGLVPEDRVDRLLASVPADDQIVRLSRIDQALGDFDAAIIATTHEFCSRTLQQLGMLADNDTSAHLVEDLSVLEDQVIADVYLRDYATSATAPPFDEARVLGRLGLRHVQLPIAQDDAAAVQRAAFVERVRKEFDARKRDADMVGFDDLVERLRAAVTDPAQGSRVRTRLAAQYPIVLVDEFQDTDPQQWAILSQAFTGHSTVILIGDPKQSIYGFRGADVYAYLDAVQQADHVLTLGRDFRADKAVVEGIGHIFEHVNLGTDLAPIRMTPVVAEHTRGRIVVAAPSDGRPEQAFTTGIQLRRIEATEPLTAAQAREFIDRDVVSQVRQLLNSHLLCVEDGRPRLLRASDIALLVASNKRGFHIQQALSRAGQAAVFCGPVSVFDTPAALAWQELLDALADPLPDAMALVAYGPFVGLTPADVATAQPDVMLDLATVLRDESRRFPTIGIPGVFESLSRAYSLTSRLLGQVDGERLLADLRHLAEALNTQQTDFPGTVADLARWLRQRREQVVDRPGDDRTRRLETDRQAVQIMTVHAAKGQEFPVVLLPQAADRWVPDATGEPFAVHWHGKWVLDPGGTGRSPDSAADERVRQRDAEDDAAALRLLYVAMTRARSRVVLWWAPTKTNTARSGLGMLTHRRPEGWDAAFVETVNVPEAAPIAAAATATDLPALTRRRLTRSIDTDWVRTSYSGLTADLHAFTPPTIRITDEPSLDDTERASSGDLGTARASEPTPVAVLDRAALPDDPPSPLAGMPPGAQFGTLVHSVFERVDPASTTLGDDLRDICQRTQQRSWLPDIETKDLVRGLETVLRTPLGGLAPGLCLADLPASDRLAELAFELPLGGAPGMAPLRNTVADLAALFETFLPADDPLTDYGRLLAASPAGPRVLAGFLTGSIDALLRLPGRRPRFLLIDYKTNTLHGAPSEPPMARHYGAPAMAQAMKDAHYPLQALLYAVAARRFLMRRVPGFDPASDMAGIGYLFVRGMAGPDTPVVGGTPCGVFAWRPPDAMIAAASRVLAGLRSATADSGAPEPPRSISGTCR